MPRHDDTVILRPAKPAAPRRPSWGAAGAGLAVLLALAGGAVWWVRTPAPAVVAAVPVAAPAAIATTSMAAAPPAAVFEPIPAAGEAEILAASPAVRTVLRFASNPAVVVLDFPTLAEQGRMLNRLAAWAEKSGVPHDRVLDDAALAATIRASGTTAETYYFGHDYRGTDVVRFLDQAARDGVALNAGEAELRHLVARAQAGPGGFGALISIVRTTAAANPAESVTPRMRAVVLHHELAHGEYFTNPAYAAYVDTVWRGVLTPGERAAFRTYLAAEGYDPALEDLMRNEMQAYLMHTADVQFFDPARLGIPAGRLQQIRLGFLAGMPPGWLKVECGRLLASLPVPPTVPLARPRRRGVRLRQGPGRVSRTVAVAETVPPRRRRPSMALPRLAR